MTSRPRGSAGRSASVIEPLREAASLGDGENDRAGRHEANGEAMSAIETEFRQPIPPAAAYPVGAPPQRRAKAARARVLGRIGDLEVRLARSAEEVRAAQKLRFHVFFEEMSAQASPLQQETRRDSDRFDRFCHHLLVVDTAHGGSRIVGTYRLMLPEGAAGAGGYYTAGEFRIGELLRRHPDKRFLELGRSCVLKEYRSRRTVELLWQGIWAFVLENRVDVLFGCASLEGTDPKRLAEPLALLAAAAPAAPEWRVSALEGRAVPLEGRPAPADARKALAGLPPLVKGYLRIGGMIGPDAVVDAQFGTTDVLVVLPVANINARYVDYYGSDANRRFIA